MSQLYFDIIPSEINDLIFGLIENPIELFNLYNSDIPIIKQILDNEYFWINKIRTQFTKVDLKHIQLNFKGDIRSKIGYYNVLRKAYNITNNIIIESTNESINQPEEGPDYSQVFEYNLISVSKFELLCPPSAFEARDFSEYGRTEDWDRSILIKNKIILSDFERNDLFLEYIKVSSDSIKITIYIGHIFKCDINGRRMNRDFIYEIELSDMYNLLFHIYVNGHDANETY